MADIMTILGALGGAGEDFKKRQVKQKQQELDNQLAMLNKGYTPYSPKFTQKQSAEQFAYGEQGQRPSTDPSGVLRSAVGASPGQLQAPELSGVEGVGGKQLKQLMAQKLSGQGSPGLKAPSMAKLPENVVRLLKPIAGTNLWQKEAKEKKSKLSAYGNNKLAEVLGDPNKREAIVQDPNLSAWEKAEIMKDSKAPEDGKRQTSPKDIARSIFTKLAGPNPPTKEDITWIKNNKALTEYDKNWLLKRLIYVEKY